MNVTLTIRRYQPDRRKEPYYEDFDLDAAPTDRVLDLLNHIKWHIDGTMAVRRSCQTGICGSDAMRINGVNRLACKTLVRDVGSDVMIEPLMGYPVIKDLVVDMEPFFEQYRRVRPYLAPDDLPSDREQLQSPGERERFDDTTKCILCAACTSSCPVYWADEDYVGPAAIVQAHRFIFDSRNRDVGKHLEAMDDREGVWRCRTIHNCTRACPRDIRVTKAIAEVKQAILWGRV